MRTGLGLRIVGSRHSRDATRLREFAVRNQLPDVWIEFEEDAKAEALLEKFGAKLSEAPVTMWQGENVRIVAERDPTLDNQVKNVRFQVLPNAA